MAEDEVAKHSKKLYKIWFDKEHNLWHKVSEFLIEMLIIVFAVSISIWFHNRSEYAHHREDAKIFLHGLKADLTDDLREMNEDRNSYLNQRRIFTYLTKLKIKDSPNKDTLTKYGNWLFNTTEFAPNDGRFEGFKSSGKIGYIENDSLQNDIMDLYEEAIPNLLASTKMYVSIKMKLFDLVYKYQKRVTDSTTNYVDFWKLDEVYNISGSLRAPDQVLERYGICISLMKKITGEIDQENGE